MIKLYGIGPSRWVRPYWMLKELELEFEEVRMSPRENSEALRELNPFGKVPVLKDGELVMFESAAICVYLADRYGKGRFMPTPGTPERALAGQWISFVITEVEQPLWRMARHDFVYPEEKRLPAEQDLAAEDFRHIAGPLNRVVTGKDVLVGRRFGVCDLLMAQTLAWAAKKGLIEDQPELLRYMQLHLDRPAFPAHLYE